MSIFGIKCEKCGFKYPTDDYILFYYDKNQRKIIELEYESEEEYLEYIPKDTILYGNINEGYCKECMRYVRVYNLDKKSVNLLDERYIKEIFNKSCNYHPEYYIINFIGEASDYRCPKCGKNVDYENLKSLCPNCEI